MSARAAVGGKSLRVLVVDGFSNHDWERTTEVVSSVLTATGRFEVDVSTAPPSRTAGGWDVWRPAFSDYDVVIQNCNDIGGGPSWPKEVRDALERYVSEGGGLFVLHSANNAFPEWREYNRMIGLGWRDKDFGRAVTIGGDGKVRMIEAGEGTGTGHLSRKNELVIRYGEHPIHRGLPNAWLATELEIYSYARGPAENLTVLSYAREPATGLNFPIEWVVSYGKGRVYNSTYGHVWAGDNRILGARCAVFQTTLVRAAEWLATGEVTSPVPDDFPSERVVSIRSSDR